MAFGDVWTIKSALDWTIGYLERKQDANARLSSEKLMSFATGLSRIEVYANFDKPLSMEERNVLREAVQRRAAGEPLQYIIGEVGFRHIDIKVRKGVLIPRPETEVLVSEVLSELPPPSRPRAKDYIDSLPGENMPEVALDEEASEQSIEASSSIYVADLCTGSGCVACSLAYEHSAIRVVATDISQHATDLAEENVQRLGLSGRVQVLQCDLGSGIDSELLGTFDAVVSNPPYVPSAVMQHLPSEVSAFEPALALDGGEDGLSIYRRIVCWARSALKIGGVLAVELHETCLDSAADFARNSGFNGVRIVNDLAGKPRVIVARLEER
ncbi:HemK/PrmC family methyltransferase [Adlercreutzia sp. ZJ154]|uniref:N5-glutamine methyltransferase family protein n=1 Tax=Adlercreutzia sp. ZJ154 TaxID=2709790 RepID=UPI0013EA6D51|nr:HemK/PrmC family methyltransferase [Adlercreutzia sp. ZJ154]